MLVKANQTNTKYVYWVAKAGRQDVGRNLANADFEYSMNYLRDVLNFNAPHYPRIDIYLKTSKTDNGQKFSLFLNQAQPQQAQMPANQMAGYPNQIAGVNGVGSHSQWNPYMAQMMQMQRMMGINGINGIGMPAAAQEKIDDLKQQLADAKIQIERERFERRIEDMEGTIAAVEQEKKSTIERLADHPAGQDAIAKFVNMFTRPAAGQQTAMVAGANTIVPPVEELYEEAEAVGEQADGGGIALDFNMPISAMNTLYTAGFPKPDESLLDVAQAMVVMKEAGFENVTATLLKLIHWAKNNKALAEGFLKQL